MPIPRSILSQGFVTPEQARRKVGAKFRRLMIASEGRSDTGKTEFALTCPGPGINICLDRGFDALLDNPNPPESRRDDFAFDVIMAPTATQATQDVYVEHWRAFRTRVYTAIALPDVRTVIIDGDSDSWELQRLAEHGKTHGVYPQTKMTDVKAARRGFYNKLWDSGKIIVATNKMTDEWVNTLDNQGNPVLENGEPKRHSTGKFVAQGFPDQEYLWSIRLRHLYEPPGISRVTKRPTAARWGIRITKCKANPSEHVGTELWGADCNFETLVAVVYPHIPPAEWGL